MYCLQFMNLLSYQDIGVHKSWKAVLFSLLQLCKKSMNNTISTNVTFLAVTLFSLCLHFLAIKEGYKSFVLRTQARNYFYDLLMLSHI